jgi:ADP-heptose:LPS heptosyltransferase
MAPIGPIDLNATALWDLRLTAAEVSAGQRITAPLNLRPYIAINMGGKVLKNDWGQGHWTQLLQHLAPQYPDHGLIIVGAQEDSARAQAVGTHWQGPVVDACGRLSPRESAAAMQQARLFIGHDSGPMHLAAAMGVPCIGLFGDNNPPAKWHPYGRAHYVIHHMSGVQTIPVDEVAQLVHNCLLTPRQSAQAS